MSYSWRSGSSRRQRKIRLFVLNRDGWLCQLKLDGCTGRGDQAHHTLGRRVTGDDPRYMVAACEHCNGVIGDPTKHNPQPRKVSAW